MCDLHNSWMDATSFSPQISSKGTTPRLQRQSSCQLERGERSQTQRLPRNSPARCETLILWTHNVVQIHGLNCILFAASRSWHSSFQLSHLCGCVFRRPEGKFRKKQSPREEALQILKPQMDNPPAPQVHTHTHTTCKRLWKNATITQANWIFLSTQPKRIVSPSPSTPAIKEGGVKPAKSSQVIKSKAPPRPLPAPPPSTCALSEHLLILLCLHRQKLTLKLFLFSK